MSSVHEWSLPLFLFTAHSSVTRREDPYFRAKKALYNVQNQMLNLGGPLTCLWSDLPN